MKVRSPEALAGGVTCCVSVVCMSSMATAVAAAAAATGAGAAGMGAMGGMSDTSSATAFLPRLFDAVGLGFLNHIPNEVLQPLLVVLLAASVGATYLSYRAHRRAAVLALAAAGALVMYLSIYAWMSEPLYFASLLGLLAASAWGTLLSRRAPA